MELTKKQIQSRKSYERRVEKYGKEYLSKLSSDWRSANLEKAKAGLAHSRKSNPERHLFNKAKNRCTKSGIEFSITIDDIVIPAACPLLGVSISPYAERDFVPSLDRIDNSKGYIPGNVWVISFLANRMKNTATHEQLTTFSSNWLEKYKDLQ